jgi:hypothetical protein
MTATSLHLTGPDELPAPRVDEDSLTVLTEAIETLSRLRTSYWLGDAGVHLHALASLIAQAETLLPQAIHDARDQELTWTDIGQLLNLQQGTAARRYRPRRN